MSGLTLQRTSGDIAARVTLGLSMIDSRKAALIRDRFWRERTWPVIAKEHHCSVTTAVKRFKQGMDDLRKAIMLVEGELPEATDCLPDDRPATVRSAQEAVNPIGPC
ncbi:MAG TPA: hypothetical protein VN478_03145 [Clostridia bacterium]|nr:hypothetical protein [Clostridia bacterium]